MTGAVFTTSGSTGTPASWVRSSDQLRAEATLVRDTVIGPVGHVVSYAPTEHLYGRLYADILPALTNSTVTHADHDPSVPPELPRGTRTLLVCLPSTWVLLEHWVEHIARHGDTVALHSTGPTTPAAHRLVARLRGRGFQAHELFGSTETGAIAHRRIAAEATPAEPWRLLPDVHWLDAAQEGEHQLRVTSPRLARREDGDQTPDSLLLPDLVRRVDHHSFHHLGRATRLVKVNGLRCDLGRVENLAADCGEGLDVACAAVSDPIRGEHYELYYASDDPALDPTELRARLARLRADLPAPRGVHRVPQIPRSSTGKVLAPQLAALTRPPADGPRRQHPAGSTTPAEEGAHA